jgi:hypothetical protein
MKTNIWISIKIRIILIIRIQYEIKKWRNEGKRNEIIYLKKSDNLTSQLKWK